MDEKDLKETPKRARVLRAADIIPPFGKDSSRPGNGERPAPVPAAPRADGNNGKSRSASDARPAGDAAGKMKRPAFNETEIPTYDLAENILAEQRQVASKRRRGPSKAEQRQKKPVAPTVKPLVARPVAPPVARPVAPVVAPPLARPVAPAAAPSVAARPKTVVRQLPAQGLPELQRIVAEIVARDIEQLCRKPNRQGVRTTLKSSGISDPA